VNDLPSSSIPFLLFIVTSLELYLSFTEAIIKILSLCSYAIEQPWTSQRPGDLRKLVWLLRKLAKLVGSRFRKRRGSLGMDSRGNLPTQTFNVDFAISARSKSPKQPHRESLSRVGWVGRDKHQRFHDQSDQGFPVHNILRTLPQRTFRHRRARVMVGGARA